METGVTEREGLERERECCAVWRRTGQRKESCNLGVPTHYSNSKGKLRSSYKYILIRL